MHLDTNLSPQPGVTCSPPLVVFYGMSSLAVCVYFCSLDSIKMCVSVCVCLFFSSGLQVKVAKVHQISPDT